MKKLIIIFSILGIGLTSFGQVVEKWVDTDSLNAEKAVIGGQEIDTVLGPVIADTNYVQSEIDNIDTVPYSDTTAYASLSDSALNLYTKVETASRTIYVSEWPVGNDTTGDGTSGTPWNSLNKALSDIGKITNGAEITIQLDTGDYSFDPVDNGIMMSIPIENGDLTISGTREQYSVNDLVATDTAFRFHSNNALTYNEVKGMWSGPDITIAVPIYENGTDYVIMPAGYPFGSLNSGFWENKTRINCEASWNPVELVSTNIQSGSITFKGLDFLTNNRTTEFTQTTGNQIMFLGCKLYVKFIRGEGMRIEKSHVLATNDGFRSTNDIINIYQCLIESTGSGNEAIELKGSKFIGDEIIIADFTNGITNTVGTSGSFELNTGVTGSNTFELMFSHCDNAFKFNTGMEINIASANQLVLDTVNYLYYTNTNTNVNGIFDSSYVNPYDPFTGWVDNDNGLRVAPENNYVLWINGIHTPDQVFNGVIETPFEEETYAASLTIDFSKRNFKIVDITGDLTINISNLPEGITTLVVNQDGTGRIITIGTGWGTVADGQSNLSTSANAKNIVQFMNDGTDITYFVVTEGN